MLQAAYRSDDVKNIQNLGHLISDLGTSSESLSNESSDIVRKEGNESAKEEMVSSMKVRLG